ncbi:MAG: metallophosphoesterase [Myxococcota bacterium]
MIRAALTTPLSLTIFVVLAFTGCSHRLSGPIHSAEGPAFVGPQAVAAPVRAAGVAAKTGADLDVQHRLVLIGDAGYYLEDDPTLASLDAWATSVDSSSVIFLGDNIYNEGMTDEDPEHGKKILSQQLAATEAKKIVIPGNHDWGFLSKNHNAKAIENQQGFVDGWPEGDAEFIPKEGCMGPTHRILREPAGDQGAVVLIALDPTPWINAHVERPCHDKEEDPEARMLERLDALLTHYSDDFVIVVSHYPMLTGGPHGGLSYGVIADMIVTPLGWMMGGLMNTYETRYADWITRTQEVFRRNPPEVYAAGHDHNLQLLEAGDVAGLYVVSGAGARERVSTVTDLPETFFAHAAEGFIVVDVGERDGVPTTLFRVVEAASEEPVFEMEMP